MTKVTLTLTSSDQIKPCTSGWEEWSEGLTCTDEHYDYLSCNDWGESRGPVRY